MTHPQFCSGQRHPCQDETPHGTGSLATALEECATFSACFFFKAAAKKTVDGARQQVVSPGCGAATRMPPHLLRPLHQMRAIGELLFHNITHSFFFFYEIHTLLSGSVLKLAYFPLKLLLLLPLLLVEVEEAPASPPFFFFLGLRRGASHCPPRMVLCPYHASTPSHT